MNKKIMINVCLALSLLSGTTLFPHLFNDFVPAQEEQGFVVPEDYYTLGGQLWLDVQEESDKELDSLKDAFERAEPESEQAYSQMLKAYFKELCIDLEVVTRFFNFAELIRPEDKEAIADRLLTVVAEHKQFMSTSHGQHLESLLHYNRESIQLIHELGERLDDELRLFIPYENIDSEVELN